MSRVVVVDDEADLRTLLRVYLPLHGFEVVGEAVDGDSAMGVIRQVRPDLVVLDLSMPQGGMEMVSRVAAESAGPAVVVYSAVAADGVSAEAIRRGAAQAVSKGAGLEALRQALGTAASGRAEASAGPETLLP